MILFCAPRPVALAAGPMSSSQWILSDEEYRQLPRKEPVRLRWTIGDEEAGRYRLTGRLHALGVRLRLPQTTIASALVFLHRFLVRQPINGANPALIPATIFLASKVEEHPRKVRDILLAWADVQREALEKAGMDNAPILELSEESVSSVERLLLRILCFDLSVTHPYQYVLQSAQSIAKTMFSGGCEEAAPSSDDIDELVQTAWTVVNDSYRTTMCIRADSREIAAAAIVLAAEKLNFAAFLEMYNKTAGDAPDAAKPSDNVLLAVSHRAIERVLVVLRRMYDQRPLT